MVQRTIPATPDVVTFVQKRAKDIGITVTVTTPLGPSGGIAPGHMVAVHGHDEFRAVGIRARIAVTEHCDDDRGLLERESVPMNLRNRHWRRLLVASSASFPQFQSRNC